MIFNYACGMGLVKLYIFAVCTLRLLKQKFFFVFIFVWFYRTNCMCMLAKVHNLSSAVISTHWSAKLNSASNAKKVEAHVQLIPHPRQALERIQLLKYHVATLQKIDTPALFLVSAISSAFVFLCCFKHYQNV